MVVDAGEAEVLERCLAQKLKELVLGRLRREGPGADVAQEAAEARHGSFT